jgi:small subunit ribosomal protein S8
MMTDPIADMLARIRNAQIANLQSSEMPLSKIKESLARILKEEGYIHDYKVNTDFPGRSSAIVGLKRKSRPGRRMFVGYREIPKVMNGMGVAILSTSRGLLTDRQARENKVGGELLAEVW